MGYIPDSVIQKAIDQAFSKYDRNGDGTIDTDQAGDFFNQVLKMAGSDIHVPGWVAKQVLKRMDSDDDGRASKE